VVETTVTIVPRAQTKTCHAIGLHYDFREDVEEKQPADMKTPTNNKHIKPMQRYSLAKGVPACNGNIHLVYDQA
jgi:hypothetical protein